MTKGFSSAATLVAIALTMSCANSTSQSSASSDDAPPDADDTSLRVARGLLEAWNEHSPDAMAQLVTPDFELFYVGDDGRSTLSVSGPDALHAEMVAYFQAQPEVSSRMLGAIDGERFVAFREQIDGGASSLAVFEIDGERVRRAWYYPAEAATR